MTEDFHGPVRIVPAAPDEGGVTIYFFSEKLLPGGAHARRGSVTCDREGDVIFSLHDTETNTGKVWGGEPAEARAIADGMRRIRDFVEQRQRLQK